MNDLVASPFGPSSRAVADTAGARQDQSRELAETQVKYLMAQQFPRDPVKNMDRILNAFTRPTLAEKSQYQFARGGTDVSGPSIRAAEAIAQQWGNIEHGFRERSRGLDGNGVPFSEVEAFCVDLESRTSKRLQFIVKHWRDTRSGGYALKDERDIYELIANQAQRRVRACILAQIPGDVTDAAMQQAETTLRSKADVSAEAMQKMVDAFEPFGVTKAHIEKRIQRRIEAIQPAQVVSLKRIYASLRDDMSKPSDWFEVEDGMPPAGESTTLKDIAEKAAARKASNKQTKQTEQQFSEANPSFDVAGFKARMDKCTDVDVLDLMADEIRDVPEPTRTELEEHYRNRRIELSEQ
ncbi:hypothetical protein GO299_04712 [Ralstonia solanacearum]|nr:hypothetical protein [Ralstonia solanacearum]NKF72418.1 hypothetical protein [Ralstonia solanacearum]